MMSAFFRKLPLQSFHNNSLTRIWNALIKSRYLYTGTAITKLSNKTNRHKWTQELTQSIKKLWQLPPSFPSKEAWLLMEFQLELPQINEKRPSFKLLNLTNKIKLIECKTEKTK